MAKETVWEDLTREEAKTLAELEKSGKEVSPAPILIEHSEQLRTLGITWKQVRTWHIGRDTVKVHVTPASKEVYDLLLGDLRANHRTDYRRRRCQIPGKLKPTISCPESNSCAECPFPEYREQHQANTLSWELMVEDSYEEYENEAYQDSGVEQLDVKMDTAMELKAVLSVIAAKNPLYAKAIILKEYYSLSVDEIAEKLCTTKRNVYFYLSEARKIGKRFKEDEE